MTSRGTLRKLLSPGLCILLCQVSQSPPACTCLVLLPQGTAQLSQAPGLSSSPALDLPPWGRDMWASGRALRESAQREAQEGWHRLKRAQIHGHIRLRANSGWLGPGFGLWGPSLI